MPVSPIEGNQYYSASGLCYMLCFCFVNGQQANCEKN